MTDSTNRASTPAAGYYADPAGGPRRRWWDGTSWTEHLEQAPAYVAGSADGRPYQPPLSADAKVNTPWGWAFALLPAVSLVLVIVQFSSLDVSAYLPSPDSMAAPVTPLMSPLYVLTGLLGWVLFALAIVFAYLDHRDLTRMGIVQPFHWAWAFLFHIPYAIGRGVVLRRRVGRGTAPMWVYLGIFAVTQMVTLVLTVQMMSAMLQAINAIGFS